MNVKWYEEGQACRVLEPDPAHVSTPVTNKEMRSETGRFTWELVHFKKYVVRA